MKTNCRRHIPMLRKFIATSFLGFILIGIYSCRTTEENYHASYETAIEKMKQKDEADRDIYNKIIEKEGPKETFVGNDTLPIASGYAWQFYGEDVPLKKYNVVVGAMKQQFNAKAFCDRLRGAGCESYVITDREKNYFVVAAGFNDVNKAAAYIKDISKHIPFKLPLSEPYIYDTARIYVK